MHQEHIARPFGYGYLTKHYEFAWAAVACWLLMCLMTWLSSPALRAIVRYELRLIKLWGLKCKFVRPSEKELEVWEGIERRRQAK